MIQEHGTPTSGEWAGTIEHSPRGLIVQQGVPIEWLVGLTPNYVAIIEDGWHTHGGKSKDDLIHDVHHALTEWTAHRDDERWREAVLCAVLPDVPVAAWPRRRGWR